MRSFVRVVGAIPRVSVGGLAHNQETTLDLMRQAHERAAQVVVFPELGLSSYTARDLFSSSVLLDGALAALGALVRETKAPNGTFRQRYVFHPV